jgi:hypothetical protein
VPQERQLPAIHATLDGSGGYATENARWRLIASLICSILRRTASLRRTQPRLKWPRRSSPRQPQRQTVANPRRKSQVASQNTSYRAGLDAENRQRGRGLLRLPDGVARCALGTIALSCGAPRPRRRSAVRPHVPGGGWVRQPRVYGGGRALVLPTCWALLALRDAPRNPAVGRVWPAAKNLRTERAAGGGRMTPKIMD